MNHKNERIQRLKDKGMSVEQIARKIGYGNPPSQESLERVQKALKNN